MKIRYFAATTLDDLKAEYRKLAMHNHPDHGGNVEIMQQINAEYAELFAVLQAQDTPEAERSRAAGETPEEFIRVVSKIIGLDDLILEICGMWLWITGDTRKHRDALKEAGCYWAAKKLAWYWRPAGYKGGRGNKDLADIRNKYGSIRIDGDGRESRYHRPELPA